MEVIFISTSHLMRDLTWPWGLGRLVLMRTVLLSKNMYERKNEPRFVHSRCPSRNSLKRDMVLPGTFQVCFQKQGSFSSMYDGVEEKKDLPRCHK